jgi:small GTP-binding protein
MERMSEEPIYFKVAVVGDSMTGKTCVLLRFIHGTFEEEYSPTTAANVLNRQMTEKNKIIKLTFFDLSGNPKFDSTRALYYRNMEAYVIVINLQKDSCQVMKNLQEWFDAIQEYVTSEVPVFVIINKKDLFDEKDSTIIKQIEAWADERESVTYKVSAKTGENIQNCFESLVKSLTKNCLTRTKNSLRLSKDKQAESSSNSKCCNSV